MAKHVHEEIRLGGGEGDGIHDGQRRIDSEVIFLGWGMNVQHDQLDLPHCTTIAGMERGTKMAVVCVMIRSKLIGLCMAVEKMLTA